eukprot:sb/3464732/
MGELNGLGKPIEIGKFNIRFKQLMEDDMYALSVEYAMLSKDVPSIPITVAKQANLKQKNRFVDILPYDETRVILEGIPGDSTSHYINASWISTIEKQKRFIATQGPKPESCDDFWRMIWQYNCHVVVMVTNFDEKGRKKCANYWSDSKKTTFGDHTIECLGIVTFPDYKVRKLSITQVGPVVVHCSAGVGRTGTVISLQLQMENIRMNRHVNIYDTVLQLRMGRRLMVQTESQYGMIYRCVDEVLRCGDTEVYGQMFPHAYRELMKPVPSTKRTGIQLEFQRLVHVTKEETSETFVEANRDCNHHKNRYHNILPFDRNRVKLKMQTGIVGSDYINASFVSSYHGRDAFIATQAPKESTAIDFWRMMYENKCQTIVMLTTLTEDGKTKCAKYWPSTSSTDYGFCRVKLESTEEDAGLVIRQFRLLHRSDNYKKSTVIRYLSSR